MNSKILILSTRDWFGAARLPEALVRAGFEVGSVSFPRALVTHARHVTSQYFFPKAANDEEALLTGVARAIEAFDPALVIPGDDPAVEYLHALFNQSAAQRGGEALRACVQRSLGDPRHYAAVQSRAGLHEVAGALALRTPAQLKLTSGAQAHAFAERFGFPVVLKVENSCAGFGTSICRDAAALVSGFNYLETRYGKELFERGAIVVQEFIAGRTAMRSVVASEGEVLAGISALKLETHPAPTGPSSVIELIYNEEMDRVAAAVTRAFGITGFASFDFMLADGTDAAHLIELNPRPTPICHLGGAFGEDLCGELFRRLSGKPALTPRAAQLGKRVALFPQEWIRNAESPHLRDAYHDVPWHDPGLVQALVATGIEQMGWVHLRREEGRRESVRQRGAR